MYMSHILFIISAKEMADLYMGQYITDPSHLLLPIDAWDQAIRTLVTNLVTGAWYRNLDTRNQTELAINMLENRILRNLDGIIATYNREYRDAIFPWRHLALRSHVADVLELLKELRDAQLDAESKAPVVMGRNYASEDERPRQRPRLE